MRIVWDNLPVIITEFKDGENLHWSCNYWARSRKIITDDNFLILNDYFTTLEEDKVRELEIIYIKMHNCLEDNKSDLEIKMVSYINSYLDIVNTAEFNEFCMNHSSIRLERGVKDTLESKDSADRTYFTKEYNELVCYSILLKGIAPLFGKFISSNLKTLGEIYVVINVYNLIELSNLNGYNPINKLTEYISALISNNDLNTLGLSLTTTLTEDNLYRYLIALVTVKKLSVYDATNETTMIVSDMHYVITGYLTKISIAKAFAKGHLDPRGEEIDIASRYKVTDNQSPLDTVSIEHYLSDVHRVVSHIDSSITTEAINRVISETADVTPTSYYFTIMGLVLKDVTHPRALEIVNWRTIMNCIYISAIVLEHWGFLVLKEIITKVPIVPDIYSIEIGACNKGPIRVKNRSLISTINELFPYCTGDNPVLKVLDNICRDVYRNNWDIEPSVMENLARDLTKLTIKQNQ